jgi:hypothetical protein
MQKLGMRGRHELSDAEWNLIERWLVERLFAWLHHFRRLVIRWEYYVENFFRHGAPRLHANLAEAFMSVYSQRSATMGFRAPVWQKGFSEIRVLDVETFQGVSEYIRNNPIRRRFCGVRVSSFVGTPWI